MKKTNLTIETFQPLVDLITADVLALLTHYKERAEESEALVTKLKQEQWKTYEDKIAFLDEIAEEVENYVSNNAEDITDLESAEFELSYRNEITLNSVEIDSYKLGEIVRDALTNIGTQLEDEKQTKIIEHNENLLAAQQKVNEPTPTLQDTFEALDIIVEDFNKATSNLVTDKPTNLITEVLVEEFNKYIEDNQDEQ
jgi:hypothetical protein